MTWWYINRAAGLVSWALLSASVVLGLLLSSKAAGSKLRPNWLQDLHRGLSGLAVVFVGIHVLGAVADSYVGFGWAEVLVPFTSSWRPIAIAWGVVSMYLLVAVEASSLLRKHIPKRWWRGIHFLSFPLFLTATAHGVTAGSEMGTSFGIAVAVLVTSAIAGLTTLRIITRPTSASSPRPAPASRFPPHRPPSGCRRSGWGQSGTPRHSETHRHPGSLAVRPPSDDGCMPTVLPSSIPLAGQTLRYRLSLEILQAGELTVAELVRLLAADGCTIGGRASKVISDALRWEVGHGRVVRVARGRYRTGRIPRSTQWWMLRTLQRRAARQDPNRAISPDRTDPAPLAWRGHPSRPPGWSPTRPSGLTRYRRYRRTRRPWEDTWRARPFARLGALPSS